MLYFVKISIKLYFLDNRNRDGVDVCIMKDFIWKYYSEEVFVYIGYGIKLCRIELEMN